MAKTKVKKGKNPHLQARLAYLKRASKYFCDQKKHRESTATAATSLSDIHNSCAEIGLKSEKDRHYSKTSDIKGGGTPRYFASQMRLVAQKGQIRLSQEFKRGTCKRCDTPLIDPETSSSFLENQSKDGTKPWADVQVVTCQVCGAQKRFHVGATRQRKKAHRENNQHITKDSGHDAMSAMG